MRFCLLISIILTSPLQAGEKGLAPTEQLPWKNLFGHTRLGGWVDFLLLDNDAANIEEYADIAHFYLYLDTRINERWRTMLEVDYLNPPNRQRAGQDGRTRLERAYVEYRHGIPARFRLGRFYTPAGLWKEKQGVIMVDSTHKPLIEEMGWIPTMAEGLEFFGTSVRDWAEWNYSVFAAADEDRPLPGVQQQEGIGLGADLNLTINERIRFGMFYGHYDNRPDSATFLGNRDARLYYGEWYILPHRLLWRSEYLSLQSQAPADLDGWYSKLKWQISPRFFANHRYDDADDLEADNTRHRISTLTLGYWPTNRLRTRVEWADHRLEEQLEDYSEWSLWFGFLF